MKKKLTLLSIILLFAISIKSQSPRLETVIQRGHAGAVKTACFSPACADDPAGGKYIVTGGRDYTAKLWETSTGREMRTFQGHNATVLSIDFDPAGKFIITGSGDKTVKMWEVSTGKLIRTYDNYKAVITSAVFTKDGKHIIIAGWQFYGIILETSTGKFVRKFKVSPNKNSLSGVTVEASSDNKHILLSEDNRKSVIIDFETGERLKIFKGSKSICGGCNTYSVYSSDGKYVAAAYLSGPVQLINIKTSKVVKTYIKELKHYQAVDLSKDGNYLLTASENKIFIFNRHSGKKIKTINAHEKNINHACFSPDGNYFLSVSDDGTAVLRKTKSGKKVKTFVGYLNTTDFGTKLDRESYRETYARKYFDLKTNIKLSPDGKILLIGKKDSVALAVNFLTGKTLYKLKGHSQAVICFDFSPDGKHIVTGSADKTIKIWNAFDGKLEKTIKAHRTMVYTVSYSKNGKYIQSGSTDQHIKIWDSETGELINTIRKAISFSSEFTPNDIYIVSGGLYKKFTLWEVDTGEPFRQFVGHTDVVSSLDFSEDGKYMVSGSWDKKARIWDLASGFQIMKLTGHTAGINTVKYLAGNKFIITGSSDGTAKLWDTKTGKEIRTFKGHKAAVTSIEITPDNNTLITCTIEGVIKVWDLNNGKEIYTYYPLTRNDWFVKTTGGFFDVTEGAKKRIFFIKGMKTYETNQFFEEFYRPGLLNQAFKTRGLINENINMYDELRKSPPPSVKFQTNISDSTFKTKNINVQFEITDEGGGINEIKILHNGKRIPFTFSPDRKLKKGKKISESIDLTLIPGKNDISVSAFSKGRIESSPSSREVIFESKEGYPDCYIMAVGINKYQNESLNLNYAKADAKAFVNTIKAKSKKLFNKMEVYTLYDKEANKKEILRLTDDIAAKAKPEDVFIFYYAGHGSMFINDFYFIPTDCTRLFDPDELKEDAIYAGTMQKKFSNIKALKQLLILDACQSGGSAELLGKRGASKEKAVAQLSRSAGIHVLASAGSNQYATEFKSLGHGLFTYVLLEALNGKADGAPNDGKITIYELKSYIDDQVPEYTKKFKGSRQYPYSFSGGNDFPLTFEKRQ